jgi:hypothetical protein
LRGTWEDEVKNNLGYEFVNWIDLTHQSFVVSSVEPLGSITVEFVGPDAVAV